jgi:hypothetical protein
MNRMSEKRAGPFAVIWRAVFATPFILVGLGSIGSGISSRSFGPVAFGVLFAGAGAFVLYTGIREMRSAESRGTFTPGAVTRAPLGPAAFGGYRASAGTRTPTALEVYGAQLAFLPLAKIGPKRGKTLAHALGLRDANGAWGLIAFSVFWNGMVWPFFIGAVAAKSAVALFLLLFVIVGAVVLFAGLKRIMALRKLVALEIDAEPAFLGDVLTVHLAQRGPVRIIRMTAALVCKEHVMYRVGTTTRREEQEIYRHELLDEVSLKVARGDTWKSQVQVELPKGPPSFHAPNNEIAWTIAVKAEIDGWPDYEEMFAFRALPKVVA